MNDMRSASLTDMPGARPRDRAAAASADPIDLQASRWLAARDAGPLSAAESEEFTRWLDANIRHRVSFLRMEANWKRAERLRELKPLDCRVDPDLLAKPTRRRWPLALAASVLAAAIAGTWVWQQQFGWQHHDTGVGCLEHIVLEDGSIIDLNTNSDLRVRVGDKREVRLLRGEARFQVAPDAQRPFTVEAAGANVHAVGTAFSVRLHDSRQVDVLVAEGQVAVATQRVQRTPPLGAGEAAVLLPDRVSVSRIEPQLLMRRMAWTNGRLEFRGESLSEAVAEFNRYNRRQIRLDGTSLDTLRVGGSFAATDPDSFVDALASAFNLRVDNQDAGTILLRPP
jgi:transmembrane sensor